MCLAVPGRVVELYEQDGLRMARLDFGGVTRAACVETLPDIAPGDYALVHVGFALARIDEAEADRIFAYLQEIDAIEGELGPAPEPA